MVIIERGVSAAWRRSRTLRASYRGRWVGVRVRVRGYSGRLGISCVGFGSKTKGGIGGGGEEG